MDNPSAFINEVLARFNLNPKEALWLHKSYNKKTGQTKETWIMYHWAVEKAAAEAHIDFDPPEVMTLHLNDIALYVVGHLPSGTKEWSFGEASSANTKNPYPWAMAEKRAKDRVTLKLLRIHGQVYSDQEAEEFTSGVSGSAGADSNSGNAVDVPGAATDTPEIKRDSEEIYAELYDMVIDDVWNDREHILRWWNSMESKQYRRENLTVEQVRDLMNVLNSYWPKEVGVAEKEDNTQKGKGSHP